MVRCTYGAAWMTKSTWRDERSRRPAIEWALKTHPAIRECLVFGIPDASRDRTDGIVACVEAQESTTGEQLKEFLLERIPAWQIPARMVVPGFNPRQSARQIIPSRVAQTVP